MANPLRVGLAGLGVVGSSVAKLLVADREAIAARAGRPIDLVRVASRTPKPEVDIGGAVFDTRLDTLGAADVDVVVELIGGDGVARTVVEAALRADKHVVTANKALLAACGNALFAAAREHGRSVGFEASVAGGIPIINAVSAGLAANRIDVLAGIVNGTSNYILTAMEEDGWGFHEALASAQRLGYAEADPTLDVQGIDAAQKLAVLAALAFDTRIDFDGVATEGIAAIDVEDIRYARELGFSIKHLGVARLCEGGVEARVHLALVPESLLIAKVSGVMNAVMAHGHAVGQTMFMGPGAGGMPTASAVVADLVALARGTLAVPAAPSGDFASLGIGSVTCPHYLKIPAIDKAGVFAEVADVLGRHDISIEAVIQRPPRSSETPVHIVILTNDMAEREVDATLAELGSLAGVCGPITRIRVTDLDAMMSSA